jgi:redox-sensitive bicupin YhaK (pirin superfamily)
VSPDGRKGSLRIHQDALVYSSILDPGHHIFLELGPGRTAWLHIVCGEARLNDIVLTEGDGVGVTKEPSVSFTVREKRVVMLICRGSRSDVSKSNDSESPMEVWGRLRERTPSPGLVSTPSW